jgi:hypothetical protein
MEVKKMTTSEPIRNTRMSWRGLLRWIVPLLVALAIVIGTRVWWVRGEPERRRSKVMEVLLTHRALLGTLIDDTERKELGLTQQAARAMLQEALWSRGAIRPARIQRYITPSRFGDMEMSGWVITWGDASGRPIGVPAPGPGAEQRTLPLTSILMLRARGGRTTMNVTLFVKTLCGYPLHRSEDARRFRDLCARVGVRDYANDYFVPFRFDGRDPMQIRE